MDSKYLKIYNKFILDNLNNEFLEYIKPKIKYVNNSFGKEYYGCFPIVKDGFLIDIRVLVPKIESIDDLSVNIHEITHAYDLYKELNKIYVDNEKLKEQHAINMEKKYIKLT